MMAFKEVSQLATEQEYEIITKCYQDLKQHIRDCIEFEDFETLDSYDITRIKELHFKKSALFWKMKVEKTKAEMEEIKKQNPQNYKQTVEYCELGVKKFTYYDEQMKAECKANGDMYSYDRHHKPVIQNQIFNWQMMVDNRKINHNKKVEVIP